MEIDEASPLSAYARDVLQAAEQSASLTRQLLLFSSKQAMQPKLLQLNEIVADVARMLQRVLGEDIALTADYSPRLPLVFADAGMLEQILLNLAVNARDAMPSGGRLVIATRPAVVSLHTAQHHPGLAEGRYVCVSVSDTGHGIPPEVLPRIFEPFFTTKEVGKGTGLGLATVYGIVKQHGGWINVDSQSGSGTTFHVWLPASKETAADSKPEKVRPSLLRGDETILLVEDDEGLRMITRQILERCGYSVLMAENGDAAMEIWKKHAEWISLLVTDVVMPGEINGIELARRFVAEKPELKVIFTSGYRAEVFSKVGGLPGENNFLQKPYQAPELARIVRNRLDQPHSAGSE
jgi:CheY-like chemotaxis protein